MMIKAAKFNRNIERVFEVVALDGGKESPKWSKRPELHLSWL